MATLVISPHTICEELPILQQIAALLDLLKDGLNDAYNETRLRAWGDLVQLGLMQATLDLYNSIERLEAEYVQKHVARRAQEGNV